MPWVVFHRRFDFKPTPRVNQTFMPGPEPKLITTAAAKAAFAAQAARPAEKKDENHGN
jgi:hypothetical protein